MSWLAPLGFLGLLAIIALILIYIIKPNYQQKFVSSTYVWKLSLKYRRKRIPVNKLRNILIFICQVLVITSCAMILSRPVIPNEKPDEISQAIYVVDASASMLTCGNGSIDTNGECRFQEALNEVRIDGMEIMANNGKVTVIIASENAYILAQDVTQQNISQFTGLIDDLGKKENIYNNIAFGRSDVEGAMSIVEELLSTRENATVTMYTDTEYSSGVKDVYPADGGAKKTVDKDAIVDIKLINNSRNEHNIAITEARSILQGNLYKFEANIVSYGTDQVVFVNCISYGANKSSGVSQTYAFDKQQVELTDKTPVLVEFDSNVGDDENGIFSYERTRIFITDINGNTLSDAYAYDDEWWFYDGEHPEVKIQFSADEDEPTFLTSAINALRTQLKNKWDIRIKEYKSKDDGEPQTEGFDIYLCTGKKTLSQRPIDGHVLLWAPDSNVKLSTMFDISINGEIPTSSSPLEIVNNNHPIFNNVRGENFSISKVLDISVGGNYEVLAYCDGNPVLWIDDTQEQKIVVCALPFDFADTAVLIDFPILIYNIFNYCMPTTLTSAYYDIGQTITVRARGKNLSIKGSWSDATVVENSQSKSLQYKIIRPGTYTVSQTLMSDERKDEYFYCRIDSYESDIFRVEDRLEGPTVENGFVRDDLDLLLWFAIALVALLFIEWLLQARENF